MFQDVHIFNDNIYRIENKTQYCKVTILINTYKLFKRFVQILILLY